jgi:hypothetical protein
VKKRFSRSWADRLKPQRGNVSLISTAITVAGFRSVRINRNSSGNSSYADIQAIKRKLSQSIQEELPVWRSR